MIIIEGMDASGKSTLADELLEHLNDIGGLGYAKVHSGGPEKYPGEIHDRVRTLPRLGRFILDRHPVISQHVYAREGATKFSASEVWDYVTKMNPVLVYCMGRAEHAMKPGESEDHAKFLREKWNTLNSAYEDLFAQAPLTTFRYYSYDFRAPDTMRARAKINIIQAELDRLEGRVSCG